MINKFDIIFIFFDSTICHYENNKVAEEKQPLYNKTLKLK